MAASDRCDDARAGKHVRDSPVREFIRSLRLRLRSLFDRRQLDQDLNDELAHHMEMRRANGPTRARFGNVTSIREACRDVWTFTRIEDLWRDVRHGSRVLLRTPASTVTIVLILALGIGANTAIFSLVNAVFIRELPVREPGQLVLLNRVDDLRSRNEWSTPLFEALRSRQGALSNVFAVGGIQNPELKLDLTNAEEIGGVAGTIVSGNFFETLGVSAVLGRVFTSDDDRFEAPNPVMVLSYDFWQRQFGGDPDVIGRGLFLYGNPLTVIGISPEEFRGLGGDFWVPLNLQPIAIPGGDVRRNPGRSWLRLMGRLSPEHSMGQAQAEVTVVSRQILEDQTPDSINSLQLERFRHLAEPVRHAVADSDGSGRDAAVACLCERGQPAVGARGSQATRNRGTAGAGLWPPSNDSAIADRKLVTGGLRWSARSGLCRSRRARIGCHAYARQHRDDQLCAGS